jgi:hypothetical protein
MRKVLMLAAALAVPASVSLVALGGGQAFAKGGPKGKVTCTSINGTTTGTVTISGCTDTNGANTGPGSHPIPTTSLVTGGTVTWDSGATSVFGAPALSSTKAKKCPGYVKSTKKAPYSGPEPSAEKFAGTVTADTSGLKIPGKYKGEVCISSSGTTITALKALKVS